MSTKRTLCWIVGVNGLPRRMRVTREEMDSGVAYIPTRSDACRVWMAILFGTERDAWKAAHKNARGFRSDAQAQQRYAARTIAKADRVLVACERALDRLPRETSARRKNGKRG